MEIICSPYSWNISIYNICFSDFLVSSIDSMIFIIAISIEIFQYKQISNTQINRKIMLLLLLIFLSYFTSLTLLLFYLHITIVSLAESIALIFKSILWLIVVNAFCSSHSSADYGSTSLTSLKFFNISRIFTSIYSILLYIFNPIIENRIILSAFDIASALLIIIYFILTIFPTKRNAQYQQLLDKEVHKNNFEKSTVLSKLTMN